MSAITVIITNHNYGRFLGRAIDSVLAQTLRDFELIVVDDGSDDESREILAAYADRATLLLLPHVGLGRALDHAIGHARGPLVAFLDADDWMHPRKLERVVAAMAEHPRWVQLAHPSIHVDAGGHAVAVGRRPRPPAPDVTRHLLRWGRYPWGITSELVCRRRVLQEVRPLPEAFSSDTYLTATVPFFGQVGYLDEPLVYYRQHASNMQRTSGYAYLIAQREATAQYINAAAARAGRSGRFDAQRDAELRALQCLAGEGPTTIGEALRIAWLTAGECLASRRSARELVVTTMRRALAAWAPREARALPVYADGSSALRASARAAIARLTSRAASSPRW